MPSGEPPLHALLIEDNPGEARLIEMMLKQQGQRFRFTRVGRLADGIERAERGGVDVALVDLGLPDSQGLETFTRLQARCPELPIVVLSGLADEEVAVSAVQHGAQDYIPKRALTSELLARAARYAIERKRIQEELVQREIRLEEAQQIAHLGSWEWNVQSRRLSGSDEIYRMFSLDPTNAPAAHELLERIHPDDREATAAAFERAVTDLVNFSHQFRFIRPDDTVREALVQGRVEVDRSGVARRVVGTCQDVTDRVWIDRLLRERNLFRKIFRTGVVALAINRASDGGFVEVNEQFLRLSGFTREELLGRSLFELGIWSEPEDFRAAAQAPRSSRDARGYETLLHAKDGSERMVQVSLVSVDFDGAPHLFTFARDVTEERRAEQRLRESELRFRTMADIAPVLIWMSAPDKLCDYFNQRWLDFTGRSMEQELGNGWAEGVHPDDLDRCLATYTRAFDERRAFEIEYRLRHHDGVYRWIFDIGVPRYTPDGAFAGYIGSAIDIEDRRRAQTALQASEEKYRQLFEESKDGLFFTDPRGEGALTDVNPAAVEIFGYASKDELLRCRPADLYYDPAERAAVVRALFERGFLKDLPVELRRKDGDKVHALLSGVLTRGEHGEPSALHATVRDVTEQKSLEEQLLHAQKMEAVGRLAGGVAHDFNNLLTVIQTATFFGKNELGGDHPARGSLDDIEAAVERAVALTRQLLAFARKQMIEPRTIDLNQLVLNLERLLRRLIGEDVELEIVPGEDLGLVRVDPGQIEQLIANLAVNSHDAMPDGGRLTIEIDGAVLGRREAREHGLDEAGNYVRLTVRDTGAGMTKDVKARVFEPFFTTKEVGKGTGLGLAICYGIVQQAGGTITVESEPGQGTAFRIYFPRDEGEAELGPSPTAGQRLPRGTETVLVVEDDAAVRAIVVKLFAGAGYRVLEATNGEEAVRVAEAHGEKIELLVSDVVMPRAGGVQTAMHLRARIPDLKVLFMSGYVDRAMAGHELSTGVAFLHKPFTAEALARKARQVLDARKKEDGERLERAARRAPS